MTGEMEEKKITIVIPNYNGEKIIEACLDSVVHQSYQNLEVIVVDDCSTDHSLEKIQKYPDIRVIVNKENSGFAKSVNIGIEAAKGEWILLLNNDVELTNDFIENIILPMREDQDIFSVSSRMIRYYERDLLDDVGDLYHVLGWAVKRGDGKKITEYLKRCEVFSTCAGAGLYRKEILDQIGCFDEHHFAYLEDIDISWRAKIHGYKNIYEPSAVCYHIGSATTAEGQKYSDFKIKLSARNNIYIITKNMPMMQKVINSPFLLFGFTFKGITFALKGYGKAYWTGIFEGIANRKTLKKVPFQWKNTKNYIKIEGELLTNFGRHVIEKIKK